MGDLLIQTQSESWLGRAKMWNNRKEHVESVQEQTTQIPALTVFLGQLHTRLHKFVSISEAMHTFPKTGQLLAKLTVLPRLLLDPDLYQALLSCILYFYIQYPASPIESRSKAWVLSQIRLLVSQVHGCSKTQLVTNVTGHTLRDFHSQCSHVRSDRQIEARTPRLTPSDDRLTLCTLARTCMSLRHTDTFNSLLHYTLSTLLVSHGNSPDIDAILGDLIASQKHPYTGSSGVTPLPYETQVLLWSMSREALEHEVLDLVERATGRSDHGLIDRINARHLPECCAKNHHLYQAVFDMLRVLILESRGHWKVVTVTNLLHRRVRLLMLEHPEFTMLLSAQYNLRYHSLVNLLSVSPNDLSSACMFYQLKMIAVHLTELHDTGDLGTLREASYILTQYLEWFNAALCHIFSCPANIVESCLRILHVLHSDSHSIFQEHTLLVESLRGLFTKSSLAAGDVSSAVSTAVSPSLESPDSISSTLPSQLLLVFSVLSVAGCEIMSHILDMVLGSVSREAVRSEVLSDGLQLVQSVIKLPAEKLRLLHVAMNISPVEITL